MKELDHPYGVAVVAIVAGFATLLTFGIDDAEFSGFFAAHLLQFISDDLAANANQERIEALLGVGYFEDAFHFTCGGDELGFCAQIRQGAVPDLLDECRVLLYPDECFRGKALDLLVLVGGVAEGAFLTGLRRFGQLVEAASHDGTEVGVVADQIGKLLTLG